MRYIHEVREVPAAKPEVLGVAYLTANPRIIDKDDDGKRFCKNQIISALLTYSSFGAYVRKS